jgi:hypothetical protein
VGAEDLIKKRNKYTKNETLNRKTQKHGSTKTNRNIKKVLG